MKFEDLKAEYAQLWASMATRTSFKPALEASAQKIIANKDRYQIVSAMTNVPWYVLETITEWSIERICFELERFNGWGYRKFHKTTLTPYLWSGTTHYARGKYVADGKWDSTHVSKQTGAMALLKRLMELDETIRPSGALVEATPLQPEETAPTSFVKADEKAPVSRPAVAVGTTAAVIAVTEAAPAMIPPAVPQIVTEGLGNASAWRGVGETIWTFRDWAIAQPTMASAVTIGVASFYLWSRKQQGAK